MNSETNSLSYLKKEEMNISNKPQREERLHSFYEKWSSPHTLRALPSPLRPSKGDIAIYEYYTTCLQLKKGSTALILGSTPVLRNLLSQTNIKEYVVADFSWTALMNNSFITDGGDTVQETLTLSNWLSLPYSPGSFDVILGDLVLWQFLPQEQMRFLEKMSLLLNGSGKLITRVHIMNEKLLEINPLAIISDTLDLPKERVWEYENQLVATLLFSRLRDRLYDQESNVTTCSAIRRALKSYKTKDREERRFHKKCLQTLQKYEDENLELVTQTESEIETSFKHFFLIEDSRSATDYIDAKFFPVYIMTKSDRNTHL
jgi:hypothetical protein